MGFLDKLFAKKDKSPRAKEPAITQSELEQDTDAARKSVADSEVGQTAIEVSDSPVQTVEVMTFQELRTEGQAQRAMGNTEKALELYEQAASRAALSGDAKLANEIWTDKGIILADLGRLPEALQTYDRALAVNPDNADTWDFKGEAHFKLGQLREALAACERALQIDPNHALALAHVEALRGMLS
jgi:tetratricopeptide (TPR) repeat protein